MLQITLFKSLMYKRFFPLIHEALRCIESLWILTSFPWYFRLMLWLFPPLPTGHSWCLIDKLHYLPRDSGSNVTWSTLLAVCTIYSCTVNIYLLKCHLCAGLHCHCAHFNRLYLRKRHKLCWVWKNWCLKTK